MTDNVSPELEVAVWQPTSWRPLQQTHPRDDQRPAIPVACVWLGRCSPNLEMSETRISATLAARAISDALRNQLVVSDASFDLLYPTAERYRSPFHWTPIEIAMRACGLLASRPGCRILDVGSGVGKLCLVGALTATHAHWVGVERDRGRAEIARRVAVRLGVYHAVQFVHGDATAIDWSSFDSIYLFNPFAEQLFDSDIDSMSRRERFVRLVHSTQRRLRETAPGTRVVTYHGIGGDMPAGFELVHREPAGNDQLCVWTRVARDSRGQTH